MLSSEIVLVPFVNRIKQFVLSDLKQVKALNSEYFLANQICLDCGYNCIYFLVLFDACMDGIAHSCVRGGRVLRCMEPLLFSSYISM